MPRLREIKGKGDYLVAMWGTDEAYAATSLNRESAKITQWLRERHGMHCRRVTVEEARRLLGNYNKRRHGEPDDAIDRP